MTRLGEGREFDLIRGFLARTRVRHPDVRLGPGDDCAIIPPFVISSDLSIEEVHFRRAWLTPEEIGYRAAAAALSDLAAVAAQPVAALVSFGFSAADAAAWAQAVMAGATSAIEQYDAVLAGGDVTRSDAAAVIDVVVLGKTTQPVLRSGAQPGDVVWVTGELGGSAAAVAEWRAGREPAADARARFAHPQPRIREALWLAQHATLHALIDLSDGIAGDAGHIAAASGCRITLDAGQLPLHSRATAEQALSGGEDYELCLTAAETEIAKVRVQFENEFGIRLSAVGRVEAGEGVVVANAAAHGGFDHFSGAAQ